ncbi:MAG: hypothetical protein PHP08_00835 [Candidatus Dojkabacteria bacterium]|nr:hypothetical protein [Candidatus Dojkabacteria bacterium]
MIKLRIDQKKYYAKKSAFKTLYKKLGLHWEEDTKAGDVWTNKDFSSYLRKIPEKDGYKRFYAYNVPEMVKFLMDNGAEDISNEEFESIVRNIVEPIKCAYEQIPENFKIVIGNNLDSSEMSEEFKKRWMELEIKYKDYTTNDFYREIEEKNKRRRNELGVDEDDEDDKEVVIKKKYDDDILPVKTSKKRAKIVKVKPVKTVVSSVKVEFRKKIFKITKK